MALSTGLSGVIGAGGAAACVSVKTVSRAKMSAKLSGILRWRKKKNDLLLDRYRGRRVKIIDF